MFRPLALAALLAAAPALAQSIDTPPAPPAADVPAPPATDNPWLHDETRADAEARAAAIFARMDLDHDGFVTLAELSAFAAARAPAPKDGKLPATPPIVKAMFEDADTDHDGRISAEESKAAADRGFDAADTDHDGVVSPAERMAATQQAARGDGPRVKPLDTGR